MGIIKSASNSSTWRGLDYYKEKRVNSYKKISDYEYEGIIKGSGQQKYNVFMDTEHPKKSTCDCPHAKDRKVICKHLVALYFKVFPYEVDNFMKEVEAAEKRYEEYEKELEKKLVKYVNNMSKPELQQTVLDLLYEGPEWMYDCFIRDRVGY